jgi:deoxyribose-phosphate aldolase
MNLASVDVRSYLEHTLLKADATAADIERLCAEALSLGLFAVCVAPYWVPDAVRALQGSEVKVVSVAGFPLGSATTATKVAEATACLSLGAAEVDMVINLGALLSGRDLAVRDDIAAMAVACHGRGAKLKVILETGCLTQDRRGAPAPWRPRREPTSSRQAPVSGRAARVWRTWRCFVSRCRPTWG